MAYFCIDYNTMSTNTLTIQSYRKTKPVYRKEHPVASIESPVAPVINMSEKMDVNYTGRQIRSVAEPSVWNMPPLVRAYFKGRDNDPL